MKIHHVCLIQKSPNELLDKPLNHGYDMPEKLEDLSSLYGFS